MVHIRTCSMRQSGEHFEKSHQFSIVRHHKDYAAENARLHRLQYSKTIATFVCLGAVTGVCYSSLDRQSRRKFRATADGVVRFIR